MANEKRLIDANELLRIYKKWIPQLESPEDAGDKRGVETCIAVLEDAPTVDAAPVVHGYWIHMCEGGYSKAICSACGVTAIKASSVFISDLKVGWRYCPSCGAKMDGDGNG